MYHNQLIYLNSDMIKNIAYGLREDQIDESKVLESINAAQLKTLIKKLPNGLNKNRRKWNKIIWWSKAKNSNSKSIYIEIQKLLIFDEATSALDNKTESKLLMPYVN